MRLLYHIFEEAADVKDCLTAATCIIKRSKESVVDTAFLHNPSDLKSPVLCIGELISMNCTILTKQIISITTPPTVIKVGWYQTLWRMVFLEAEEEKDRETAHEGWSDSILIYSCFCPNPLCWSKTNITIIIY